MNLSNPFRRIGWPLVGVVTSFTLAHSVTLIAAAYGMVPTAAWFPPLIETLIAVSILYMAIENVLQPNLQRRWLMTFAFGLVHGFGFSFLLQSQLQFAGSHLLGSLLAFNLGIELGQLAVLAIAVPLLSLVFRRFAAREKALTVVLSLVIGHTAWHWTVERVQALATAEWPAFVGWAMPAGLAGATLLVGALAWWVRAAAVAVPALAGAHPAGVDANPASSSALRSRAPRR